MTESQIQQKILIALNSRPDCRLFRNHVETTQTKDGRWVSMGLCVGSSDLIGWFRGRFLAIEVKAASGRTSPEQDKFIAAVQAGGGIAGVARSVEDALEIIQTETH